METTGQTVKQQAEAFLDKHWPRVLEDLETLVAIDSSQDLSTRAANAPYGAGPRRALDAAFALVRDMGFEPVDCEGHCGYFDIPGSSARQLAIIGHLDVVPAGTGWSFDPFALTRKDGYLVGRGVTDDKGPLLMALHALRFWHERYEEAGEKLPCTVRFIFGCCEETGMGDADYYLEHHAAPDFLITPDADFPLCYGEKGQLQLRIVSAPVHDARIVSLTAGVAMNGVPATAEALVKANLDALEGAERIELAAGPDAGTVLVRATGIAGHAAMPEGSVNALHVLASYLLDSLELTGKERAWFEFVRDLSATTDGASLGIDCEDADFGALTCVASMASLEQARYSQSIDIRFPTSTCLAELERAIQERAASLESTVETVNAVEPLLVPSDSAHMQALGKAYEEVTGCPARLFTMGGGTYAHHFPTGVSFGAMDEARFPNPAWLGGMHAANEGVAEDCLRQALLVYIAAFGKLFALDWSL